MASDIGILLIDEAKQRGNLARFFGNGPFQLIGEAGYGTEAVTIARECRPDVIVLNLEEPVARSLRTVEILNLAVPDAGIIVTSTLTDRDVMRKAMRAGARDYVFRPAGREDLQRAVISVYEAAQKKHGLSESHDQSVFQTGEVVVLYGAKGGIGKTTLAVNLAFALAAETKQRVALVDLDVQMGDIALMLSIFPERNIVDAAVNADQLEPDFLQSLVFTDLSGVRVLAAPTTPEDSVTITEGQVGLILAALSQTFDYTIVDTSPVLNDINVTALEKATLILQVTTSELPSLKRTKISLGLLLKAWSFSEDRVKLIVNHPYAHAELASHDVESALDYPVFWTIPHDPSVAHSVKVGRPCVESKPGARFSRNVTDFARMLAGVKVAQPRRGLMGLLRA